MKNRSTLFDKLVCDGIITAGVKVCNSILSDMEVYGFIPQDEDDTALYSKKAIQLLDFNMKKTIVVSNRLAIVVEDYEGVGYNVKIQEKRIVHPILRAVQVQENGKEYNIPLNQVYIPKYMDKQAYIEFKSTTSYKGYGNGLLKLKGIQRKDEPVSYTYSPSEDEYLFIDSSSSNVRAVGNSFSVVCRRINPVTGNIVYDLFSSEELFLQSEL